ncbi:MAG: ATP-binding cassette domain-containing protein, partial [Burkholderiales bacterium]|nr:ATP-binding cassette domain-containing protein [Burkholderiales bacterium]
LLGSNGAGKSTLAKALAGTLPLAAGERHVAQNLAIGYFAQHQLEQLDPQASPLLHLQRIDPQAREQELRDFLGGFDFRGAMATEAAGPLSGGEKARLVLALIVRAKPQLLILDEPTNHLDIEMREALAEALQDYGGALVVVAHDRHLLAATTDAFWLVQGGRVEPFAGDLDDYRDWVLAAARSRAAAPQGAQPPGEVPDRRARRREEAQERQRRADARKPHLARQAKLEAEMEALAAEKDGLDAWLASPQAYADEAKERLRASLARQGELAWTLARLESEWLEIAESLERIDRTA